MLSYVAQKILMKLDEKTLLVADKVSEPWKEAIVQGRLLQKLLKRKVRQRAHILLIGNSLRKKFHTGCLRSILGDILLKSEETWLIQRLCRFNTGRTI
jgi:hypothetical protein